MLLAIHRRLRRFFVLFVFVYLFFLLSLFFLFTVFSFQSEKNHVIPDLYILTQDDSCSRSIHLQLTFFQPKIDLINSHTSMLSGRLTQLRVSILTLPEVSNAWFGICSRLFLVANLLAPVRQLSPWPCTY